MHPDKVDRDRLQRLTDLPNVGPSIAGDLRLLGYREPRQLIGVDPFVLYRHLCEATGQRQDPCVLDTFMAITDFLAGNPPQPWWAYTAERKQLWVDAGMDDV